MIDDDARLMMRRVACAEQGMDDQVGRVVGGGCGNAREEPGVQHWRESAMG